MNVMFDYNISLKTIFNEFWMKKNFFYLASSRFSDREKFKMKHYKVVAVLQYLSLIILQQEIFYTKLKYSL